MSANVTINGKSYYGISSVKLKLLGEDGYATFLLDEEEGGGGGGGSSNPFWPDGTFTDNTGTRITTIANGHVKVENNGQATTSGVFVNLTEHLASIADPSVVNNRESHGSLDVGNHTLTISNFVSTLGSFNANFRDAGSSSADSNTLISNVAGDTTKTFTLQVVKNVGCFFLHFGNMAQGVVEFDIALD